MFGFVCLVPIREVQLLETESIILILYGKCIAENQASDSKCFSLYHSPIAFYSCANEAPLNS